MSLQFNYPMRSLHKSYLRDFVKSLKEANSSILKIKKWEYESNYAGIQYCLKVIKHEEEDMEDNFDGQFDNLTVRFNFTGIFVKYCFNY